MIRSLRQALREELESNEIQLGRGWISGVLALVLSLAALALVLCAHFPSLFTVPELRKLQEIVWLDTALQMVLLLAFVLAFISLILRQNKLLGLAAAFVVFTATILGNLTAQTVDAEGIPVSLGLDWFVLNLLITGSLFLPLEHLFRRIPQSVFRFEWRDDLLYFGISSVMVQTLTYFSMLPANTVLAHTNFYTLRAWVGDLPLLVQLAAIMFLTDFVQYWLHRAFHQVPFLWKFHSVHHSAQAMDWLAGSRMHFIEIICLRGITIIPMYTLGFSNMAIYSYIIIVYLYATYLHANLRFNVEFLKPFIATPRFHHWHHGIEKEAIDVNFSIHFPVLDRWFGTYYMPENQWPSAYGVKGNPVPPGFIKQLLYPFMPKRDK